LRGQGRVKGLGYLNLLRLLIYKDFYSPPLFPEGVMSHVVQGSCYIGTQSEVYDTELHAIAEGLQQISQSGVTPGKMYICIDNQAAIDTLWENKLNSEPARHAIKQANILKAQGWNILTV
jgi:hypothetical protein